MKTAMFYLEAAESNIQDFQRFKNSRQFVDYQSTLVIKIHTVWMYSLLYLVQTGKLKLSDPMTKWEEYTKKYQLPDHYKVANSYLRANNQEPLDYKDKIFHYYTKKRSA